MSDNTPSSSSDQDPNRSDFSPIFDDFVRPLLDYDSWKNSEMKDVMRIGIYLWNSNRLSPEAYSELQSFLFQSIDQELRILFQGMIGSRTGFFKTHSVSIEDGKVMVSKKFYNLELKFGDYPPEILFPEYICEAMMADFVRSLDELGLIERQIYVQFMTRYQSRLERLIAKNEKRIAENEAKIAEAKTALKDFPQTIECK